MTDEPVREAIDAAGLIIDSRFEQHATDISHLAERVSRIEDIVDDYSAKLLEAHRTPSYGNPHTHPAHVQHAHGFREQQANDTSRERADRLEAAYRQAEGLT